MNDNNDQTMKFKVEKEDLKNTKEVLMSVFNALKEKGYDPTNQIIGYLLSGDPTYITNYDNARTNIIKMDRDELLEAILKDYLGV